MRKIKWALIIIMLMATSGCWQYQDLNKLAAVSAIGIDKVSEGYSVSIQVINVKKLAKNSSSSSSESPITVYEATANTISEALNKMYLQSPKELYLGHIDMVVIGEETAKLGIREYIDYLLRERKARKIYPVLVAKGSKASEVLRVLTPIETLPSSNLRAILENSEKNSGVLTNRTFDNVLMCLYIRGRYPTIPAVEIIKPSTKGEETDNVSTSAPETKLQATGPAVLLDDKLVGYFSSDQALGYNFIRKRVKSSVISFTCDDKKNYGGVRLDKPKIEMTAKIIDDKPQYQINLEVTATLEEFNCSLDLKDEKNISKVEKMVDDRLKQILEAAVMAAQKEFKSDVLGMGEVLYRNYYDYWVGVEKDWDKMYPNVEYEIKTKTTINNTGSITIPAREGGKTRDN